MTVESNLHSSQSVALGYNYRLTHPLINFCDWFYSYHIYIFYLSTTLCQSQQTHSSILKHRVLSLDILLNEINKDTSCTPHTMNSYHY